MSAYFWWSGFPTFSSHVFLMNVRTIDPILWELTLFSTKLESNGVIFSSINFWSLLWKYIFNGFCNPSHFYYQIWGKLLKAKDNNWFQNSSFDGSVLMCWLETNWFKYWFCFKLFNELIVEPIVNGFKSNKLSTKSPHNM